MKCSSIAVLALAIPSSTLVSAFVMVIPKTIMYVNEKCQLSEPGESSKGEKKKNGERVE
jgi:hypothetical protein